MYYVNKILHICQSILTEHYLVEEGGGFQNGMNYQRLEEECWQSEPNLASEIRRDNRGAENQGHQGAESGFRREKKIFDDDNDEHVLYFQ